MDHSELTPEIGPGSALVNRADAAWQRLRNEIAADIIRKLPATLPLDAIPVRLNIPPSEIRKGLADGTLVSTIIANDVHMVCDASHRFLSGQSQLRLLLPESLRPIGAASTLTVWEPVLR